MVLEGKEAMDAISKKNFGLMTAWRQESEGAGEAGKSPMVLVCDTGIMKSVKSGRGAGSEADLI